MSFRKQLALLLSKEVPKKYAHKLEYLVADGNEYIILNYKANLRTNLEIKVGYSSTTSQRLFGSRTSTSSSDAYYVSSSSGNFYSAFGRIAYQSGKSITVYTESGTDADLYYVHSITASPYTGTQYLKWILYERDTSLYTSATPSSSQSAFTTPNNVALFNAYANGSLATSSGGFKGRFYYANISERASGSNTVTDKFKLIPVLDYNNVVCLYDEVSDSLLYNQGSNSFTAGPIIS